MKLLLKPLIYLYHNIERIIIIIAYVAISSIVFVEVIRRFIFNQQAPWSTVIPIYLFLFLTWIGAAYNAKMRTHLTFDEFRRRLPYTAQFLCLILDYVCWITLACFVIYYSLEQMQICIDNYSIVYGTDLFVWYFYTATPLGWILLVLRVTENLVRDFLNYRAGRPLIRQFSEEEVV